ncbi:MotA/TolQ/ExbB proton channel family protein [Phycisphaerales bacterium AB-hyl4]|uniref:MotA/TolQ/ExbB proton channel family protein n=1 Tax=Natronomicrosphaera hydrolytica TaxID=3242702 RepID=A0ABV4UC86_9BACT
MTSVLVQGGWVMVAIVALSLIAWAVMAWKWLTLRDESPGDLDWAEQAVALARRNESAKASLLCDERSGCLARVMRSALTIREPSRAYFEKYLQPLLDSESVRIHRGLMFVQTLGAVAPLLGLLGTVIGMVRTFASVTATGMPETEGMAAGVSQALVTTQAGLVVGLAIMLVHGYLASRARRCIDTAELYAKKVETAVLHD